MQGDDPEGITITDTERITITDTEDRGPGVTGPTIVGGEPVVVMRTHKRDAREAMELACDYLRRTQTADGYWKGELETNVTMDAEDVLLRHFLGILDDQALAGTAARIRSQQRADGPWATFYGGPGELSATVEAYVALRLAGDAADQPHMQLAADWARQHGGVEAARVFTHVWLAMVGRWDWDKLPVVPPEIIFLPPNWPLSIWSFGCWARQTIVALAVISAHRPCRPLPFEIEELKSGRQPQRRRLGPAGLALMALDRALHYYEELPADFWPKRLVRGAALREAERWIVARQEADGSWGGIQPPMVYSTIALVLQGYTLDHPVLASAIRGLDAFTIDDEAGRRVEACQSPVWDTALAVIALLDAGADPGEPALKAARDWLVQQEVTVPGDWAVRRPDLAPSGWAFEFANVHYPDIDDTAEVVIALRRALGDPDTDGACRRGVDWVVGMQSRDGGWGAFDADNDSELPTHLPFFDFGAVTDPPTADVTAHVVEMLACEPKPLSPACQRSLERGVEWLSSHQEQDGSYWGRWGVNYVYGIGAVVPALVAAGTSPKDPLVADATRWLLEHQNADGGWGEDLRSYVEPGWHGRGVSTASQTAWALLALLSAGERHNPAAARGVEWLVRNQTEDGTWDEPWFTGTGFPWDFSLNYHLYRHVFPLTALGRYLLGTGPLPKPSKRPKRAGRPVGGTGRAPATEQSGSAPPGDPAGPHGRAAAHGSGEPAGTR
jgi:squalene-hopene/tetraprenyl-beta-curcumene cyclase